MCQIRFHWIDTLKRYYKFNINLWCEEKTNPLSQPSFGVKCSWNFKVYPSSIQFQVNSCTDDFLSLQLQVNYAWMCSISFNYKSIFSKMFNFFLLHLTSQQKCLQSQPSAELSSYVQYPSYDGLKKKGGNWKSKMKWGNTPSTREPLRDTIPQKCFFKSFLIQSLSSCASLPSSHYGWMNKKIARRTTGAMDCYFSPHFIGYNMKPYWACPYQTCNWILIMINLVQ